MILKSLLKLYELKNMSFQKRKYCESRIAIILQHLYPLLFLTSNKKLTILSKDIYQNMHLFLLLKRIKFENGFKLVLH